MFYNYPTEIDQMVTQKCKRELHWSSDCGIYNLKRFDSLPNCLFSYGAPHLKYIKIGWTGDLQIGHCWRAHRGELAKMALSSHLLYTVSPLDEALRSFDLMTQEKGPVYLGHNKPLTYVTLDIGAKNEAILYTASCDGSIKIWDTRASPACQYTIQAHNDAITKIKILSHHNICSSSHDGNLKLYDKRKLPADPKLIDNSMVLKGHTSVVTGFHTDKKAIYSYSRDGNILIWKWKTSELKAKVDVGYPVTHCKMWNKKYLLVYGHNSLMELFTTKGKKINTFSAHTEKVTSVFFYDSDYFFSGSDDRTIRLWNIKKKVPTALYAGHTDAVNGIVSWSSWIYSGSTDTSIRQWNNIIYSCLPQSAAEDIY